MGRYLFELATLDDDQSLRGLLAQIPMRGEISIAFARHPSYFSAAAVDGSLVQVGIVRERESSRIIGMGSRALSSKYINGDPLVMGYLSGLRLLPEFRGHGGILARGYRFFRELHSDRRAPFYLTTIATDNEFAIQTLTSARAGLPVYHPFGSYVTSAISSTGNRRLVGDRPHPGLAIRTAEIADRDEILEFLHENGPVRQFFPDYQRDDLFGAEGLLKGLRPEDVLLAYRDGELVGTVGQWDQREFKQIVVHEYQGWLRAARPLYNLWAMCSGRPMLPSAGSVLPVCLAAIPIVRDDDPEIFRELLRTMLGRLRKQRRSLLLIGMHHADPLLRIVSEYSGHTYRTNLYLVYWPGEPPDFDKLMHRLPYLELGSL